MSFSSSSSVTRSGVSAGEAAMEEETEWERLEREKEECDAEGKDRGVESWASSCATRCSRNWVCSCTIYDISNSSSLDIVATGSPSCGLERLVRRLGKRRGAAMSARQVFRLPKPDRNTHSDS